MMSWLRVLRRGRSVAFSTRLSSCSIRFQRQSCGCSHRNNLLINDHKRITKHELFNATSVAGGVGGLQSYLGFPIQFPSVSTTHSHWDSEVDRVSQAYLRDNLMKSVQKHDGNRLVYEVRGQSMLRFVSLSFYATAAFGLYVAPDFISSALENEALNHETVFNLIALVVAVIGLPASLRMLSKRLILKLYHNEARETYLAVTQSIFLTNKMTKFSLDDVMVTAKKGVLNHLFNLTSFKAKRQPYHVNPYNFKLPSDYNHLLKFD